MTNTNQSRTPPKLHDPKTFFLVLGILIVIAVLYTIAVQEEEPQVNNAVTITTWIDTNADGLKDENEPPLGKVCIWTGHSSTPNETIQNALTSCPQQTSDDGTFTSIVFADTFCNQLFSYAMPPTGYTLTTDYSTRGCKANFGFIQEAAP
ncbi:MAG: hypothetical protein HZB19_00125 [Chloroflexi bacterium]|nr:hypothetical protein [Chloroflexota bacterium]